MILQSFSPRTHLLGIKTPFSRTVLEFEASDHRHTGQKDRYQDRREQSKGIRCPSGSKFMIHWLNQQRKTRRERATQERNRSDGASVVGFESVDEVIQGALEDGKESVPDERNADERGDIHLLLDLPAKVKQSCDEKEGAEHHGQQSCLWYYFWTGDSSEIVARKAPDAPISLRILSTGWIRSAW